MNRYSRHILLNEIGKAGQERLLKAKVLVVGAGGLGCPALQYLAAAGVGTLGIMDDDIVEVSNLQRQILFGESVLGKNKALAAKERLTDLNAEINIIAYPARLTPLNALTLFNDYDIIVDGTDNFSSRYLTNDASLISGKPLVYGSIYKFEGQVSVFNYQGGPSYRCLFPSPPKAGEVPNCSEIGVLGVLPGIIGAMQAHEVLKLILNLGDILSGRLLIYNTLSTKVTALNFHKSEEEIEKVLRTKNTFQNNYPDFYCETTTTEILAEEAFYKENAQFIDVREKYEQPTIYLENVTQIPLSELKNRLKEIDNTKQNIIFCQIGIRSKRAVSLLQSQGFKNCYSVKGGAMAIVEYKNRNEIFAK